MSLGELTGSEKVKYYLHIAEQKGKDKEEVNSFLEEAGFRLMP